MKRRRSMPSRSVRYLRVAREERKAILAISTGWRCSAPPQLDEDDKRAVPGDAAVGVDPRNRKLSSKDANNRFAESACVRLRSDEPGADRRRPVFRRLLDEANRGNSSFYPDRSRRARGRPLASIAVRAGTAGGAGDRPQRAAPIASKVLADNTDGIAVVNTNDPGERVLARRRRPFVLLPARLLLDERRARRRFQTITVRVNRAACRCARRGYLAASEPRRRRRLPCPRRRRHVRGRGRGARHRRRARTAAGFGREVPIRVQVVAAGGRIRPRHRGRWVSWRGKLDDRRRGRRDAYESARARPSRLRIRASTRARSFRVAFAPTGLVAPGEHVVRFRARRDGSPAICQ